MSEQHNKLHLGLLLQHAGLISDQQLQKALELQAQYTEMKLGEILVLEEGLRVKTIDFFINKWQESINQGQIFPIGYYLQQAYLLTENQVDSILKEQKKNKQKFGELAVKKGWIKQDTVNFFLENLSLNSPQLMSLTQLEEYDQTTLCLDRKYANHTLILSRILGWTGGIPALTIVIGQTFAQSNSNIPPGSEVQAVDRFVEGTLIRKWQTSKAAAPIRAVRDSLLNNARCAPKLLLSEYQDILLCEDKADLNTKEQKELQLLGLVVSENSRLKVSNIIYQQIFNREFIIKQLDKLQPKSTAIAINKTAVGNSNNLAKHTDFEIVSTEPPQRLRETKTQTSDSKKAENKPEPLTKVGSIITCAAIALLIPLFLTINNYYSSLSQPNEADSDQENQVSELQQSCAAVSFADLNIILSSILELEANQEQLQDDFPPRCARALNQLRVIAAPQLGKESRILEAVRHLCNVPANSEVYIEAEVWLKRWYSSANWGEETKFYLQERNKYDSQSCPAGHFSEYES